jgi:carboxymethylenebutenolidase
VVENEIILKTNDGLLDCRVFIKNKKKFPTIIFYMDAPGIREELRVMCRKIAHNGYNVILPNLFYRCGTEGNYPFDQNNYKNNKEELKKMVETMNSTKNSMIIEDTKFIIKYIDDNLDIKNKIGIVGYCMSGRFVVSVAAVFNKRIKATASFYGVDIITKKKDSPHLLAKKIKGELYLAFAEKDIWVPKKILDKAILTFSDLKIKSKVEVYKGTDHGFAFPERSTYNKKAALKHWKKLINLFNDNLK